MTNLPSRPWGVAPNGYPSCPVIRDADGMPVCEVSQRSGHPLDSHPATDAARDLILAAPQMMDTLRRVWREMPDGHPLRGPVFAALEPTGGVPPTAGD